MEIINYPYFITAGLIINTVDPQDWIMVGKRDLSMDGGYRTFLISATAFGGGSGYQTIEDEGVLLPQRTIMNFVGSGVTVTDVAGKTVVTIPGAVPGIVSIIAENTLFVDSVYGNNATALPERMDKPYLTIAGAMAVATSGQMIFVRPGDHSVTTNIFKDGVKIYTEANANINFTGPASTITATPNGVFYIVGDGNLFSSGANGFVNFLAGGLLGTELLVIDVNRMMYTGSGIMINGNAGNLRLKTKEFFDFFGTGVINGTGVMYYDIDIDIATFTSSAYTNKPIFITGLINAGGVNLQSIKIKKLTSTGHDFGIFNFNGNAINNTINLHVDSGVYYSNGGPAACLGAVSGAAIVNLSGDFIIANAGGIYCGNNAVVFNKANITQSVGGGVSNQPILSVSGTSAKVVNYAKLVGGTDDYTIGLGIVEDATATGADQTAETGTFENHGVIVQTNAGLNAHIIVKEGTNPTDTMLILGAETILYGATNTNLAIDTSANPQDIKCYGSPVSNCDVDPLITNVISGTNIIWDTLVEVNY